MATFDDFLNSAAQPKAGSSIGGGVGFADFLASAPQQAQQPETQGAGARAFSDGMSQKPERSWGEFATDQLINFFGHGGVNLVEAGVGLADFVTSPFRPGTAMFLDAIGAHNAAQGARQGIGKSLEGIGYDPKRGKGIMTGWQSDKVQAAERAWEDAGKQAKAQDLGAMDSLALYAKTIKDNPDIAISGAVQSLPSMLAGGAVGRGVNAVAGKVASPAGQAGIGRWAGAIGEGAVAGGAAAEQIRQETPGGVMDGKGAAATLGTGITTAAFGRVGGKVAEKIGARLGTSIADIETMLAQGAFGRGAQAAGQAAQQSFARAVMQGVGRVTGGAVQEGVFEELPQSVTEQMWQNWALGKDVMEGVGQAAVLGAATGAAMGAGANVARTASDALHAGAQQQQAPQSGTAGTPSGGTAPAQQAAQQAAPSQQARQQHMPQGGVGFDASSLQLGQAAAPQAEQQAAQQPEKPAQQQGKKAGFDYDAYVAKMRRRESGGKADALNPASGALGADQFLASTWLGLVRQAQPAWAEGKSEAEVLAMRADPEKSAEMRRIFDQGNATALRKAGLPVNEVTMYAAHHFGAGGAVTFLRAADDTPTSSIFSEKVLRANPHLQNKTKAQVLADFRKSGFSDAGAGGNVNFTPPATSPNSAPNAAQEAADAALQAADEMTAPQAQQGQQEAPQETAQQKFERELREAAQRDAEAKAEQAQQQAQEQPAETKAREAWQGLDEAGQENMLKQAGFEWMRAGLLAGKGWAQLSQQDRTAIAQAVQAAQPSPAAQQAQQQAQQQQQQQAQKPAPQAPLQEPVPTAAQAAEAGRWWDSNDGNRNLRMGIANAVGLHTKRGNATWAQLPAEEQRRIWRQLVQDGKLQAAAQQLQDIQAWRQDEARIDAEAASKWSGWNESFRAFVLRNGGLGAQQAQGVAGMVDNFEHITPDAKDAVRAYLRAQQQEEYERAARAAEKQSQQQETSNVRDERKGSHGAAGNTEPAAQSAEAIPGRGETAGRVESDSAEGAAENGAARVSDNGAEPAIGDAVRTPDGAMPRPAADKQGANDAGAVQTGAGAAQTAAADAGAGSITDTGANNAQTPAKKAGDDTDTRADNGLQDAQDEEEAAAIAAEVKKARAKSARALKRRNPGPVNKLAREFLPKFGIKPKKSAPENIKALLSTLEQDVAALPEALGFVTTDKVRQLQQAQQARRARKGKNEPATGNDAGVAGVRDAGARAVPQDAPERAAADVDTHGRAADSESDAKAGSSSRGKPDARVGKKDGSVSKKGKSNGTSANGSETVGGGVSAGRPAPNVSGNDGIHGEVRVPVQENASETPPSGVEEDGTRNRENGHGRPEGTASQAGKPVAQQGDTGKSDAQTPARKAGSDSDTVIDAAPNDANQEIKRRAARPLPGVSSAAADASGRSGAEEAAGSRASVPESKPNAPKGSATLSPAELQERAAGLDRGDVLTSDGRVIRLQNRDRGGGGSVQQMNEIAAAPQFHRVSLSNNFTGGAPVVFGNADELPAGAVLGRDEVLFDSKDDEYTTRYAVVESDAIITSHTASGGINENYATGEANKVRAVAGNGRAAALAAAWERGTMDDYRAALTKQARSFGLDADAIASMKRPVLVRVMREGDIKPDMGDRTNTTETAQLSPQEQAANDAKRIDLSDARNVEIDERGQPTRNSLMRFINATPAAERAGMLDARTGEPTRQAVDRFMAAIFKQAYQSDELVRMYAQASDPEARNVLSALANAAPLVAQLTGKGEYDLRAALASMAEDVVNAVRRGEKLRTWIQQEDFGRSEETSILLDAIADDIRAPKRMSETLKALAQLAKRNADIAEQSKSQLGFDGFGVATLPRSDLFKLIAERTVELRETRELTAADVQDGLFSRTPIAAAAADTAEAMFSRGEQSEQSAEAREFAETERAYGGEKAYEAAKKAGKTKLTYRQWVQVRTPAFKAWFGDWESAAEIASFNARLREWVTPEIISSMRGVPRDAIFEKFGNALEPIAYIPEGYLQFLSEGINDNRVYSGKGYFIDHAANHHPEVDAEDYYNIQGIINTADDVKLDTRNPNRNPSLIFIKQVGKSGFVVVSFDEGENGKVVLHKTFFTKTKKGRFDKLPSVKLSPGGGNSPISHAVGAAPAGRLSALGDAGSVGHIVRDVKPQDVSAVVDENGEPMVVFHGSGAWFTQFNDGAQSKQSDAPDGAIFMSDNREIANSFIAGNWYGLSEGEPSKQSGDTILDPDSPLHEKLPWGVYRRGGIYPLFVNMRNPKVVDFNGRAWNEHPAGADVNNIVSEAKDAGHDGVIARNIRDVGDVDRNVAIPTSTDFVAFSSSQVKSATDNVGTFDANNPDIRFSRGADAQTSAAESENVQRRRLPVLTDAQLATVARVREMAAGVASAWKNAPRVHVVHDLRDIEVPRAVRDMDEAMRSQGAQGEPEAVYYNGEVYIFAGQANTEDAVARVIAHEVLVHHGLRGAFGDALNTVLSDIQFVRRKGMVDLAREYGLFDASRLPKGMTASTASNSAILDAMTPTHIRKAAEEVLARMGETQPQLGFVRRAVAAIRTWLRQNVPGFAKIPVSDDEIIRNYILPAREWVQRERSGRSFAEWQQFSLFSRSKKTGEPQKPKRRTLKAQMDKYREAISQLRFEKDFAYPAQVLGDKGRTRMVKITPAGFSSNIGVASDGTVFVRGENNIWRAATATALRDEMRREAEENIPLIHKREMAQWQRDHDIWEAAELGKQLGLDARIVTPSDSTSRYVYLTRDDGAVLKVRAADHAQPVEGGRVVGGFDSKIGKRHDPSHISIDPASGATLDDALNLVQQFADGEQVVLQNNGYTAPVRQLLQELLDAARAKSNENREVTLGEVAPELVKLMQERDFPVYGRERHTADVYAVRHAKRWRTSDGDVEATGDGDVEATSQLPITDDDVRAIGDVVNAPDAVLFRTKGKGKTKTLAYIKQMPDGTILYIEQLRTGRGTLALKDMKKYPAIGQGIDENVNPTALDAHAIANGMLPTDARSDRGDVEIVPLNDAFRQLMEREESGTSSHTQPSSGGGGGISNAPQAPAPAFSRKSARQQREKEARGAGGQRHAPAKKTPGAKTAANDTAKATHRAADSSDGAAGAGATPRLAGRGATQSADTAAAPIRSRRGGGDAADSVSSNSASSQAVGAMFSRGNPASQSAQQGAAAEMKPSQVRELGRRAREQMRRKLNNLDAHQVNALARQLLGVDAKASKAENIPALLALLDTDMTVLHEALGMEQSEYARRAAELQRNPQWREQHGSEASIGENTSSSAPMFRRATQGSTSDSAADRAQRIIDDHVRSGRYFDRGMRALTRALGIEKLTRAIGGAAANALQRFTPEKIKAGLVADYGLPVEAIDARVMMQGAKLQQLRQAGSFVEQLSTLTNEEAQLAYDWMTNESHARVMEALATLPDEKIKVLFQVRDMIDALGQEAVDLGLLSNETYQRNKSAYLHRSYTKHVLGDLTGKGKKRGQGGGSTTILGTNLRHRGIDETARMEQVRQGGETWWDISRRQGKADENFIGRRLRRLERRSDAGEGTATLPGIEGDKRKGRVLEVVYVPASEAIPSPYKGWHDAGVWEVRDTAGDKLQLWRDYTAQERADMGEIKDVRYAIMSTLQGMIGDVETARYLRWLSREYAKAPGEEITGEIVDASEGYLRPFLKDEWVRVPETNADGTKAKRYGALAGKYVPGPVFNDIRHMLRNGRWLDGAAGDVFHTIMQAWKTSKTSLSPTVHVNNIMSNFVMADWADLAPAHLTKAMRIIMGAHDLQGEGVIGRAGNLAARATGMEDREAAREIVQRYKDSGGELGSWTVTETMRNQMEPLLEKLQAQASSTANMGAEVGVMAALQRMVHGDFAGGGKAAAGAVARGVGREAKTVIDLYGNEDAVFRLAAWLKAKEEGKSDVEAGRIARNAFLDYNINAPWIQLAKGSVLPFISFSYRGFPLMMRTMTEKPHKMLKFVLFATMLNQLGLLLAGADDDDEVRRLLPDEKAGRVWGMVPKLIRMPWNDANDSPVYLDIRRWIPMGDVFDVGQGHAALPVPPALMPGGPLAVMQELLSNKSNFTGKEITLETDTPREKAGKVAEHLYKSFAPNVAGLPGTWATTNIGRAARGETDVFGREQSVPMAVSGSFGVKLGAYPPDVLRRNVAFDARRQEQEIGKNISAIKRQLALGRITPEEAMDKMQAQQEKKRAVREKTARKMGAGERSFLERMMEW